jgi:hypothetical protein
MDVCADTPTQVISDLLKEAEQMGQAKRSADDEAIPRMVKRVKL